MPRKTLDRSAPMVGTTIPHEVTSVFAVIVAYWAAGGAVRAVVELAGTDVASKSLDEVAHEEIKIAVPGCHGRRWSVGN